MNHPETQLKLDQIANGERTCRRDRVRDIIVTRILDGTYPPGMHLKELPLAAEFEVSQAPVREALRELEMLGLVATERYCGTKVLALEAAELAEAYELRAVIEERSAQLAVCDATMLGHLRATLAVMKKTAADGDFSAYADAAAAFHRTIVVQSSNRQFLRAWDNLRWDVRSRIASRKVVGDLPLFAELHGQVLVALEEQDGKRAGKLLRKIIDRFIKQSATS